MEKKTIKLSIKLLNGSETIEIEPTATVSELKEKIKERTNVKVEEQRLVLGGMQGYSKF